MLARLPAGAPVFVLDAESDDETVAVARALGADVESRRWTGFVTARRYALGRVRTGWALMLDADELLDETLRAAIGHTDEDVAGYRLLRMTMLCGRAVRTAGWSNERLLRLVRTDRARVAASRTGAQVHETWSVDGNVADLPGAILHDSYPTLASYRSKFDRYTNVEAEALKPSRRGYLGELALMLPRFAWSLLRYGGWHDGWRGLFVAWESARYRVVVRAKALRRA